MTRESKLALIVGFGLILFVGILVSDHFSAGQRQAPANLLATRGTLRSGPSVISIQPMDGSKPSDALFCVAEFPVVLQLAAGMLESQRKQRPVGVVDFRIEPPIVQAAGFTCLLRGGGHGLHHQIVPLHDPRRQGELVLGES